MIVKYKVVEEFLNVLKPIKGRDYTTKNWTTVIDLRMQIIIVTTNI